LRDENVESAKYVCEHGSIGETLWPQRGSAEHARKTVVGAGITRELAAMGGSKGDVSRSKRPIRSEVHAAVARQLHDDSLWRFVNWRSQLGRQTATIFASVMKPPSIDASYRRHRPPNDVHGQARERLIDRVEDL
jgi:hypothetical protein